jgi:hypothetical protein
MQTEFDEHSQEEFSDDSVNLRCVLSARIRHERDGGTPELAINFHNSFHFDSNLFRRQEKVVRAIVELRRIESHTACFLGEDVRDCAQLEWSSQKETIVTPDGFTMSLSQACRDRAHVEAECRRHLRQFPQRA